MRLAEALMGLSDCGYWGDELGSTLAGKDGDGRLQLIPDYFGDLNVIVAAIDALPPTWNSCGFERILAEILNLGDPATDWKDDWTSHIKFAQASAAERAEALGRDLELWKEGE